MINLRLDGAVRTLILTLRARAEEQTHDSPLFNDTWSQDWFKFMPKSKPLDDWYHPAFQLASVIRTHLIDQAVEDFIGSHDNPLVVELGAGFSTRYFRLGKDKTHWIELDLEEAIVARRKLDIEVAQHWFIASDMTDTSWFDLLPEADAKNTLFIAEGTLMFLEPDALNHLFDALAERFSGATFVFDVVNPDYLEEANGRFSQINAPMQWGITVDELSDLPIKVNDIAHLLLQYPERWDAIGVDASKRIEDRSGFVVAGTLD
ncbi:MAG: class I SAM-dependent methyltransferase [Chloroflexota bacterium]